MKQAISALLVHRSPESLRALKQNLESQSIQTMHAPSCRAAGQILCGARPPHLVFTETTLPDGTWAEVVASAACAPLPVNVVVVAHAVDTRFYIEVIEAGAFDFIVPPFTAADLAHVVHCAADNVLTRRAAQASAAPPPPAGVLSALFESEQPVEAQARPRIQLAPPQPRVKVA